MSSWCRSAIAKFAAYRGKCRPMSQGLPNVPTAKPEDVVVDIESRFIKSILLSRWDYCWLTVSLGHWNGASPISEETDRFLRKYTLVDELPRQHKIGSRIEIKLNYFSTSKMIVLTSSFNIYNRSQNEPLICSLCVVFREDVFPKVIENYTVIANHVERLSKFYKSLHLKNSNESTAIAKFNVAVLQFVRVFNTLCVCGLRRFHVSETLFSANCRVSRLLSVAVTSHLQTHGFTVVVGRDPEEVRQWVNSLSLFLLPRERKRCRHAKAGVSFVPELFVQGVLLQLKQTWKDVVPIRNILFGSFPVTIVDLVSRRVLCFKKYNFFLLVKKNFQYLYDSESSDQRTILKSKHVEVANASVPCVDRMLRTLFQIPEYLRRGYISEWIRLLNRRALAFTKLINLFPDINKVNIDDLLRNVDVNRQDRFVVLAASEKIQPGVYVKVLGNLSQEVETVIDFLENL